MLCPNCGNELRDGARYCPACGADVAATAEAPAADAPTPPAGTNRRMTILVIVLAVIAAALAIGIALWWHADQKSKADQAAYDQAHAGHTVVFRIDAPATPTAPARRSPSM